MQKNYKLNHFKNSTLQYILCRVKKETLSGMRRQRDSADISMIRVWPGMSVHAHAEVFVKCPGHCWPF